jgi:flagellar biosynthetic protein FliQ
MQHWRRKQQSERHPYVGAAYCKGMRGHARCRRDSTKGMAMGPDTALKLFSDLLLNTLLVCAPVLLLTMLVGLVVSIVQVITQIQDMSITFVPKIIAAFAALLIFGPWMLRKLLLYATALIAGIPGYF